VLGYGSYQAAGTLHCPAAFLETFAPPHERVQAGPVGAEGGQLDERPFTILSPDMQEVFGGFGGKLSFQRSPTRWVDTAYIVRAAAYFRALA
jgi:hypothetical protein